VEYPDSYPADEPNRRAPDIRKAKLQLEFAPAVDLDEGLKRFLDWADSVYTGEQ
ncbi:MAG: nucleoside-diphosphate sugar epimerase, partial [Rhodospirillaceae bacterium]|nr:nucleoside-diphosphate sugar epimerase [Rhodospirillaceae bacterium]MBT5561182.1 nucleoside-diphosphate sugar epimerase [Rhodospirillaceae bacterium]MBT6243067.1 nucleoside-diphosphate sugar epimerase [Rhodospirillaceae bacterium]